MSGEVSQNPQHSAEDVRSELAELADIVRVIACESRCKYAVLTRIDSLINRLIGDGCGPHSDGDMCGTTDQLEFRTAVKPETQGVLNDGGVIDIQGEQ